MGVVGHGPIILSLQLEWSLAVKCWIEFSLEIVEELKFLAEAPRNHSDLAKMEEKGLPLAAYGTGAWASDPKTNKQTWQQIQAGHMVWHMT